MRCCTDKQGTNHLLTVNSINHCFYSEICWKWRKCWIYLLKCQSMLPWKRCSYRPAIILSISPTHCFLEHFINIGDYVHKICTKMKGTNADLSFYSEKKHVCVRMYVKTHRGIKKRRDALVIINRDSLLYEKKVKWGNRADFNTFAFIDIWLEHFEILN